MPKVNSILMQVKQVQCVMYCHVCQLKERLRLERVSRVRDPFGTLKYGIFYILITDPYIHSLSTLICWGRSILLDSKAN